MMKLSILSFISLKFLIKIILKSMSDSSNIWITFWSTVYLLFVFPTLVLVIFSIPGMLNSFFKKECIHYIKKIVKALDYPIPNMSYFFLFLNGR